MQSEKEYIKSITASMMLEKIQLPLCLINPESVIVYSNPMLADLLHTPLEHILNQPLDRFASPESKKGIYHILHQNQKKGTTSKGQETIALIGNNIKIWVNLSISTLDHHDLNKNYYLIVFSNTSCQNKTLYIQREFESLFLNRSKAIKSSELANSVTRVVNNVLGSNLSYCFFIDEKKDCFESSFWSSTNTKNRLHFNIPVDFPFSTSGAWTESYYTRKITLFDKNELKDIPDFIAGNNIKLTNLLSIPVYFENRVIGVLGSINKAGGFDESDFELLQTIALNFSMLVTTLKLHQGEAALKKKLQFSEMKLLKTSNKLLYTEEKLKETNAELLEAKHVIDDLQTSKNGLLRSLTQEIRTPMNAILGFSDLLKEKQVEDEQKEEFVSMIDQSSKQMMQVVNNIVDLSKIENGTLEIVEREFSINNIILELNMLYYPIIWSKKGNHVKLSYKFSLSDRKSYVVADEKRVRQVLNNLLNNAIKYTNEGEIEISYQLQGNNFLLFSVRDTGIGISQQCLEHVFESFNSGCTDSNQNKTGISVGLYISKNLVNIMNGEMWVESLPGTGSTFYFTLPYKGSKPISIPQEVKHAGFSKVLNNKKILIAEDDFASYKLLEKMLMQVGAEVIHANNGLEAVNFVTSNNYFDVILMDIKMPVMDGIEATRKIKKYNSSIPIIIQTAYTMYEEESLARKAECDDFITKPITKDQLLISILDQIKN